MWNWQFQTVNKLTIALQTQITTLPELNALTLTKCVLIVALRISSPQFPIGTAVQIFGLVRFWHLFDEWPFRYNNDMQFRSHFFFLGKKQQFWQAAMNPRSSNGPNKCLVCELFSSIDFILEKSERVKNSSKVPRCLALLVSVVFWWKLYRA